jgi:methionine biosynthesis protein MetW
MLNNHDKEHFSSIWKQKSENLINSYHPGQNLRVDYCIDRVSKGEKFLDIGCGTGILASALRDRFAEVYGIDIAEQPLQVAKENHVNVECVNLNSDPLPFPDNYFDTVTILSVLQFIYDISFCLSEISRVLKPGGTLLLIVPNMRTYWRIARILFSGHFPRTSKDLAGYDGGSIHYFCSKDLVDYLPGFGFSIKQMAGIMCIPHFVNKIPDQSIWGAIKREFFSAEFVIEAIKSRK